MVMYTPPPQLSDTEVGEGEEYELRPAAVPLYDAKVDFKIVCWRAECFEAKGFAPSDATVLALRRDVDRVYVERLIDEGATHAEVRDIVL